MYMHTCGYIYIYTCIHVYVYTHALHVCICNDMYECICTLGLEVVDVKKIFNLLSSPPHAAFLDVSARSESIARYRNTPGIALRMAGRCILAHPRLPRPRAPRPQRSAWPQHQWSELLIGGYIGTAEGPH